MFCKVEPVSYLSSSFCVSLSRCIGTLPSERTPAGIQKLLNRYSRYKQTPVTLRQLLDIGSVSALESYKFLRGELPTRLCHAIVELESIPGKLMQQPSAREISKKYRQSFLDLVDLPSTPEIVKLSAKRTKQTVIDFSNVVDRILKRHEEVTITMGMGILELKQSGTSTDELFCLKDFLDRFYMSRIGLRTHLHQFLAAHREEKRTNWIGLFDLECDIKNVIEDAVDYSSTLCRQNFCDSPKVVIDVALEETKVVCYPRHLHYILTEVLKNSMRAVLEFHGEDTLFYPDIKISVYIKNQELVIKVSDLGGGIPQEDHAQLFSYSFSTASKPDLDGLRAGDTHFAGFGYGLALSRLHARYFGGELTICPVYGHGTDVYIYLKHFDDAAEVLPSLDRATLKRYASSGSRIPNMENWMHPNRQAASTHQIFDPFEESDTNESSSK